MSQRVFCRKNCEPSAAGHNWFAIQILCSRKYICGGKGKIEMQVSDQANLPTVKEKEKAFKKYFL